MEMNLCSLERVKGILPTTNFQLLGEQLVVGKDKNIGKCDTMAGEMFQINF